MVKLSVYFNRHVFVMISLCYLDEEALISYRVCGEDWSDCADVQAHYENTPIQIYRKNSPLKPEKIQIKNSDIFQISAQNIDCWYS